MTDSIPDKKCPHFPACGCISEYWAPDCWPVLPVGPAALPPTAPQGENAELIRLLHQRYRDMGDTIARKAAWALEDAAQRPIAPQLPPSFPRLADTHRGWCNYCKGVVEVCRAAPEGGCSLRDVEREAADEQAAPSAMILEHRRRADYYAPPAKTPPLDPTPAMIEAGAQRLVRWETGKEKWPDAWSKLDVRAARNDAERCWRSMWLEAEAAAQPTEKAPTEGGTVGGTASLTVLAETAAPGEPAGWSGPFNACNFRGYCHSLKAQRAEEAPTQEWDGVDRRKDNWTLLLKDTAHRIGKQFRARAKHRNSPYTFFGLVHGDDDYYYGFYSKEGGLVLSSCVGDIEDFGDEVRSDGPEGKHK